MKRKKKKENKEEIETLDEEKMTKSDKSMMWTIILTLSIIVLLASTGLGIYLYQENKKIENEITESKDNIQKVEESIKNDQKTITEKEDEYEKLKEKVKDNLEELKTWENLKEELNKSLS